MESSVHKKKTVRRTRRTKTHTPVQEDDVARTPDETISSTLLSPYDSSLDDLELENIIRQSREEYALQESIRQQKLLEKSTIEKTMAIPLARLHMWYNYSHNDTEKILLQLLFDIVDYKLALLSDTESTNVVIPKHLENEFQSFLDTLQTSKLYHELCSWISSPSRGDISTESF